jgi:hypothetical protein
LPSTHKGSPGDLLIRSDTSKTGYRGVGETGCLAFGKYVAKCETVPCSKKHIGSFNAPEKAAQAYLQHWEKVHPGLLARLQLGAAGEGEEEEEEKEDMDVPSELETPAAVSTGKAVDKKKVAAKAAVAGAGGAAPLDPSLWQFGDNGEMPGGHPQSKGELDAYFKHSQSLDPEVVWRMQVTEGGDAIVGIAAEGYDAERADETETSTAGVNLGDGDTVIYSDISEDGQDHYHEGLLKDYIPETKPYDVALRISKDGNVPQIQFNNDNVWHDFAPDRVALKAGPWFPFLGLDPGDRLTDLRIDRPRANNGAGMKHKPAAETLAPVAEAAVVQQQQQQQQQQQE